MRGQLFSMDFLASVLVVTVALGLFVHALEFSVRSFPAEGSSAPLLSSALLFQRHAVALDPARMVQGGGSCGGKATGSAWCYPLTAADGPVASAFADSASDPQGSLSFLTEAGVPLGPAHSSPTEVQSLGRGRFSDFRDASGQRYLLFSSLDNAPPASRGPYQLVWFTVPAGLEVAPRDFCVFASAPGNPPKTLQDNCGSLAACPSVSSSERYVECGGSRCVFSVRVCGGQTS